MAYKYETIVPWGRSFEEYRDMFDLTPGDLDKKILGCGDGPACFNSVMTHMGRKVISVDPLYQYTTGEIQQRIDETYENVISQTRNNTEKFIWTKIKDVDDLGRIRMESMKAFLADYDKGKTENRYICAELPNLPFEDRTFGLSLSSHFLFLYSDNLSLDFHIRAIDEMLRVADEARIFPLLDVNAGTSPYVEKVINRYYDRGIDCEIVVVDYEFQKGGNKMLKVRNPNELKLP